MSAQWEGKGDRGREIRTNVIRFMRRSLELIKGSFEFVISKCAILNNDFKMCDLKK
jgi:hypothetical protein